MEEREREGDPIHSSNVQPALRFQMRKAAQIKQVPPPLPKQNKTKKKVILTYGRVKYNTVWVFHLCNLPFALQLLKVSFLLRSYQYFPGTTVKKYPISQSNTGTVMTCLSLHQAILFLAIPTLKSKLGGGGEREIGRQRERTVMQKVTHTHTPKKTPSEDNLTSILSPAQSLVVNQ